MTRAGSPTVAARDHRASRSARDPHDTYGRELKPQQGELLEVDVRLVVSPICGVFHQPAPPIEASAGGMIRRGDVVGEVHHTGGVTHVKSWLFGLLVEMLVVPGERVHDGQPVAWVRALVSEVLPGAPVPKPVAQE